MVHPSSAGEPQRSIPASDLVGVGAKRVGPFIITVMTLYLILFPMVLIYCLIQLWPAPVSAGQVAPSIFPVTLFLWTFPLSDEVRLLIIVVLASAIGSLVHALRSFYWHVGHRQLLLSWLAMYILLPFVGVSLGLVFYFVIRGGFFSPQATVQQTSPFGFAALGALIGLFSQEAVLKLKQLAETMLVKRPEEKITYEQVKRETTVTVEKGELSEEPSETAS